MAPIRPRSVLLLPFLLLLIAATWWGDWTAGEELMLQRHYREAAAALAAGYDEAPQAQKDRVLFLLGQAHLQAGDPAAAIAAFARVLRDHPGSGLVHQARFGTAKAEERAGNLRGAALIWRDEIERLVGLQRKEEVAAVYLGLAEKAQSQDPPDPARAVTFYDLALDLGLPPDTANGVRLKAAEAQIALAQFAPAIARLVPLVADLDLAHGKLRAMLALGRARRQAGDLAQARTTLRDLRAAAPDSGEAGDAAWEIALTYGAPTPGNAIDLERAIGALQDLAARHPSHAKAKIAAFVRAQCYRHAGRADAALAALREFLAQQGDSGLVEVAQARAMVGDVLLSQDKHEPALAAYRDYLRLHPAHAEWERVQRAIVDTEYAMAEHALAAGKEGFAEARQRFLAFAAAWPLDPRNAQILFVLGEMLAREEKWEEAQAAWGRCVSKYPDRDESSRAQFEIGQVFENKVFHYESALAAYRKVTWGPWVAAAQERIRRLTQKHLHLRTERIFRSDETAAFTLTSRNVEKVRVRVFRLDLEDYFRATHTAGDVARLDIEVIEADKTFESGVPDYLRHRETTRQVPIGFDRPGAYVVKVDDRELEATTMVLVSDLALIAKSSRHEFFVFTQNTLANRAQGGVKVVLSDGSKVLAEGVTAPDGVWRWQGKELASRDELRVFAIDGSGSGASSLGLSGLGQAQGLTPKGYLFTDRPLYQPQQRVHFKGIVREVAEGLYRLPATAGYRVQVWSAAGRLLLQRDVSFTRFGTFAGEIDLPADAELGDWRLGVSVPGRDDLVFSSVFTVARYERPRLQLKIELAQPVVWRGEPIRGRVLAQWFYGEPAGGRDVTLSMQLPDGSLVERSGKTNAAGELPFELPTTEFAEEALAALVAAVRAENLDVGAVVPVVTTEFTPVVSTVRGVYLAGESFQADVVVQDRSGRPLARELAAVLLRLDAGDGKAAPAGIVEVEVDRKAVTTGADGKGKVAFRAAKGGEYRVRLEGKDRFGTLVSGSCQLTVSGDDDEVKLRLLCDRDTFTVGEQAAVKVANRAGERLALLTWQGDGILQYEARVLAAGESELALPIEGRHAPNFALAIAMVDGGRLHVAERDFRVLRDLQLQVTVPAEARPGDEVEVAVQARDPQGRPVAAEVAIAMVDEALLAVRGDRTAPIGAFFWGQLRETAFRTASSCTWSYDAPASRVSSELLAEERREADLPGTAGDPAAPRGAPAESGNVAHDGLVRGPTTGGVGGGGGGATRAQRNRHDDEKAGEPNQQSEQVQVMLNAVEQDLPQLVRRFAANDDFFLRATAGYRGLGWDLDDVTNMLPGAGAGTQEPRRDFSETGGWISAVVTDATGLGKARLRLPHSTTSWRVHAKAVTADTFVGQAEGALRTRKELQVDAAAPAVLTEGDRTTMTVRVHDLGDADVSGQARWELSGGATGQGTFELRTPAHGEQVVEVPFAAVRSEPVAIALQAQGGQAADALARTIPVVPFGVERRVGRSGSTSDRVAFDLSLPDDRAGSGLQMVVQLGPDPGRDLVAAALGVGHVPSNCRQVEVTNLARSSRGLAAFAVAEYLGRTGAGNVADQTRLLGVAQAMLATVVGGQLGDGAFAWVGRSANDVRTSCQVTRFLAAARRLGLAAAEEPLHKAAEWLLQVLRTAPNEQRADVLWALAEVDRARFESLNSLHRVRAGLDVGSLARLALAWHVARRPELAAEVGETLRGKLPAAALARHPIEVVALATRAMLLQDRRDALGIAGVQYLRGARTGAGWGTPEGTAAAIAVMCLVQAEGAGAPRATEVSVRVNGRQLATMPAQAQGLDTVFQVPTDWVKARDNQVQIEVAGGGEVFWSASLVAFVKDLREEDRNRQLAEVERTYVAVPARVDGQEVPTGFASVTGSRIETFTNQVTRLAVGESCRAVTSFQIHGDEARAAMTPVVLEEPIPAGCSVSAASIRGSHDHVELQPDRLVFYFRQGLASGSVTYDLQARFCGQYRVLPTALQGASRPELLAYGAAGELAVQPVGGPADAYRMTPDEAYWRGSRLFEQAAKAAPEARREAFTAAGRLFDQLLAEWHKQDCQLRDEVFKEVARMMLFCSIERGDARGIVRFFEELKDRYADLVIPFDKILAVGRAYLDLGEFEAALLVFRATAEASFVKEAAVATTLEGTGEVAASTRFLEQLLLTYPDMATMRTARYAIGQRLAALAADLRPGAPVDERVGSAVQLRGRSLATFREFLILHGEDPLAEEVAFAWATTCVEGKDVAGALAVCERALQTYPQSPFTDEFLYTTGWAQFVAGRHDEAFSALQRVATEEFPRPQGGTGPSESRWHAIYLQGQVHHARGEPAKALAAYAQVEERFSDAGEAADYFRRRQLALPEVTTFTLGQPPEVTLSYRNVRDVTLQVFRVDLMRLYLLEKSLNDIGGIQLHGIAPQADLKVALGDGRDYRTVEKKIPLALEGAGAWLVVVRGDDQIASGMVLRTDLRIEAQEQFDAGRIRVNVKRGEAFLADAHVKVIGSGDQRFRSGDTDLRGIFVGDDLVGAATVIVKKDEQYAFYRGTGVHQPQRLRPTGGKPQQQQVEPRKGKQFDALEGQSRQNADNRARQVEWLKNEVFDKKQQGVEVHRTK